MGIIGSIRKHSWIAVAVVGVAIVAFIIGDLTKNNRGIPDMGKINGSTITYQRFTELTEEMENNYKRQQGVNQIPADVEYQLRDQVWQTLVGETLTDEQFEKLGLTVSPAELNDMYVGTFIHPYLRQSFTDPKTGEYQTQAIQYYVDNFENLDTMQRMQWVELEKAVKTDRKQQKYSSLISRGMYMPTAIAKQMADLSSKGMKKLIIDLRSNTGGYLGAAIQMANQFLPKNDLIVYTQGAHNPTAKQYADGRGHYQTIPLVVMIDESSASAAEIFTGAIQDNDRGTIVGRRSFGKGLVQEPIDFADGSSIRITIARYYTPSGRCIQKPYGESDEDYAMDIIKRYEHGEFFTADSIKQNEDEVYKTKGGRTVYGGGGIMPDIFVAQDTTGYSKYYSDVVRKSLINKYSFKYVDSNRAALAKYRTFSEIEAYLDADNVLNKFYDYAAKNGVKRDYSLTAPARKQMRTAVYGNIIYDALDMQDYIAFINQTDPTITKAVEALK